MKKKKYKNYHTGVKVCYSLGLQNELLPRDFTTSIPSSTSFYWKQNSSENYLGTEYVSKIETDLENIQLILNERLKQYTQAYFAFCRLYILFINHFGRKKILSFVKNNRNSIISFLDKLPSDFDRKKVSQFFLINLKTYRCWKLLNKYSCKTSLTKLCFKRFPNQISQNEIKVLRKFMESPKYRHWSTASVWGKAFRTKKILMSRSSWYYYCKKMGLYETRILKKAKRKNISIRANYPNHTWHMDVSVIKTFDHVKFYAYTVVDNYSRKILAHTLSKKISGKIRLESLKKAIESEFDLKISPENKSKLDLIVDGGSENNNATIQDFIKNCHVKIDKKIALKDVAFSNSVIEGTYRIMKSSYFKKKQILSTSLEQELDYFVNDYNYNRPHYYHKIYTPDEVFQNPNLRDTIPLLRNSNKKRITSNRNFCCKSQLK